MDEVYNYFSGLGSFIIYLKDMISNEGLGGTIEHYATKIFDFYTDLFLKFIDNSKEFFGQMGSKAISVFTFDFTSNFFVCVIGFIFGFFILKFALGKVFDLVGRWLDPM